MVPDGIKFALFCHGRKKSANFMSKGAILKIKGKNSPI